MDPAELRRRNLIRQSAMPYKTPLMPATTRGDFAQRAWTRRSRSPTGRVSPRAAPTARSAASGAAPASATTSRSPACSTSAWTSAFDPPARSTIVAGTFSHGQGHETIYAQMVSRLARRAVREHPRDPGRHRRDGVRPRHLRARARWRSAARRSRARPTRHRQGQEVRGALAGGGRERHRVRRRHVHGRGHRQAVAVRGRRARVLRADGHCRRSSASGSTRAASFDRQPELPERLPHLRGRDRSRDRRGRDRRYIAVDDVGIAINPLLLDGQIHGGVAQGVGQALIENIEYDAESGAAPVRLVHGLRHAARRLTVPTSTSRCTTVPTPTNPLGRQGRGRGGHRRRAARGHQRDPRRAGAARRRRTSTCRRRRSASGARSRRRAGPK